METPRNKRKLQAPSHSSEPAGNLLDKIYWADDLKGLSDNPPKKRWSGQRSTGKKPSKRKSNTNKKNPDLPEYLLQRRQEFDDNRKRHHEAALMLPPDYTGIPLVETKALGNLEERPVFPAKSRIVPTRPYKDIELPQSAGLIPASIAQYLRDYQVEGVKFLHRKFVYQEGAVLGDDMGLGKTVQVVAFLTAAFGKTGDKRDAKRMREMRSFNDRWYPRILIICPGSLYVNWNNELDRWGWWHTGLYHGSAKDDVLKAVRAGHLEVMITTYDTYKGNKDQINLVQWDAVIADECHCLKKGESQTTKAMMEVNALCRIGLTGTAMQNNYNEFWTLLNWTNPGHFGALCEWKHMISKPLTVGQSHDATRAQLSLARQTAQNLVQNLLPRYFLRRMKTLIAHQLPKKADRVVFCPLTDLQRHAYENFISSPDVELILTVNFICKHGKKKGWCCDKTLSTGKPWQSFIFPSMMALQKLANHLTLMVPTTTDLEQKQNTELCMLQMCVPNHWETLYAERDKISNLVNPEFCGKWKILKKLLKFWHSNNDKVLVFSHSVRLLHILHHLFTSTSYTVSYLDGSLAYEARQEIVDTFNADPHQFVFLISTKAGGVGLNITAANKVVIVDPHWNPAYDLQAQDRAYRIGQTRDVEVFRLISRGTVEEIVYARQIYKQQQANIGYTASSERRYFKGVQQDSGRKGEIFGLDNIFRYQPDDGLLRDIVNKTNIAEARAGVNLADVDMEETKTDNALDVFGNEFGEDGGLDQLAERLKAEDQNSFIQSRQSAKKADPIQAILNSAGVDYSHENSEVIGTSKVEEQLSRQAAMKSYVEGDAEGNNTLFNASQEFDPGSIHGIYHPPKEVRLRQFCEMAQELGFANATEFALVVECWTQEARTNCLDTFYQKRLAKLMDNVEAVDSEEEKEIARKDEKSPEAERVDTAATTDIKYESDQDDLGDNEAYQSLQKISQSEKLKTVQKAETPLKREAPLKMETPVKTETPLEMETPINMETIDLDKKAIKKEEEQKLPFIADGSSKRHSIFLSDDSEDDGL